MQLELDLWPVTQVREPRELVCWFCGEANESEFSFGLNHPPMGDVCGKAWITLNHMHAIVRRFEGDPDYGRFQNCYAETCDKHYQGEWSKTPIPECALLQYREDLKWVTAIGVPSEKIPQLPEGIG